MQKSLAPLVLVGIVVTCSSVQAFNTPQWATWLSRELYLSAGALTLLGALYWWNEAKVDRQIARALADQAKNTFTYRGYTITVLHQPTEKTVSIELEKEIYNVTGNIWSGTRVKHKNQDGIEPTVLQVKKAIKAIIRGIERA